MGERPCPLTSCVAPPDAVALGNCLRCPVAKVNTHTPTNTHTHTHTHKHTHTHTHTHTYPHTHTHTHTHSQCHIHTHKSMAPHLKSGGSRLGLVEQREAPVLDHGVSELQFADGAPVD